jgi:hypothetical protein
MEDGIERSAMKPGWRLKALASATLFLIGALLSLMSLADGLHVRLPRGILGVLGLSGLGVLAIGLIRRLPRWSLPYIGMIGWTLSWGLFHDGTIWGLDTRAGVLSPLLGWADGLFLTVKRTLQPGIVRAVVLAGWEWIVLLVLTVLGVLIVAITPSLRPLYARIRRDWTLLSFALYGASAMAALCTFEEAELARFPKWGHAGGFLLFLMLAGGAWGYVRGVRRVREDVGGRAQSPGGNRSRRPLPLFAAMVLAMVVGTAGRAIVHSKPTSPDSYWRNALTAAMVWGWAIVVVLSPALLTLLPRPASDPASRQNAVETSDRTLPRRS